jgi:hypothetical protein
MQCDWNAASSSYSWTPPRVPFAAAADARMTATCASPLTALARRRHAISSAVLTCRARARTRSNAVRSTRSDAASVGEAALAFAFASSAAAASSSLLASSCPGRKIVSPSRAPIAASASSHSSS